MFTIVIVCILFLLGIIYLVLKRNLSYWKNRDVPFPKYNLLFGNMLDSLTVKKSLGQIYTDMYNDFKDYRYVGFYKIQSPSILLRDPELIKSILIQNFESFSSNGLSIDEKVDPLSARNAFVQNGHKWKLTRSQISRCFTGGKLRTLTPLLEATGKRMASYVNTEIENVGTTNLDTKELMSKFTIDNVSTCAFGIDGDSFVNPDSEFIKYAKKIFEVSTINALKVTCMFLVPSLATILKVSFIPKDVGKYLLGVVEDTLRFRKENKVVRKDFLHYMQEIKETPGDYEFKDIDIAAQCASFFLDGYETSSITITFALYVIAKYPDVQNKVKAEMDTVLKKYGGELPYDAVKEMTYMEQVISESQRLYPVIMFLTKVCTKEFVLPAPNYNGIGKEVTVKVGTAVVIPHYSVQHDEQYFSNPEQFDPDRFSDENKYSIDKGTFLGWGVGPRICLGLPFAMLQTKMGIISILKDFEIRVNKKTQEPLEFDPKYFMLSVKGGVWLDLHKRAK